MNWKYCAFYTFLLIETACSNAGQAHKNVVVPSSFEQQNKDFIDILFARQNLDELSRILQRQEGVSASGYWNKYLLARAARDRQQPDSAVLHLKAILAQAAASRSLLWAYNGLRELGAEIDPGAAKKVLGFVAELPGTGEKAYLAAYADGTIRFLDVNAEPVIWDTAVPKIQKYIGNIIEEGKKLKLQSKLRKGAAPRTKTLLSISFLTPAGIWHAQADPLEMEAEGHMLHELYLHLAAILVEVKEGL